MGNPLPPLDFDMLAQAIASLNRTIAECDAATTIEHCSNLHGRLTDVLARRNRSGEMSERDVRLVLMALSALRVMMDCGSGGCSLGLVTRPPPDEN